MKRVFIIGMALIIGFALYYVTHPLVAKVRIGETVITVDVAVTESQKQLGLGGRDSMKPDRGMLFSYDHKEQYEFWMRGMRFPLDFIWLDGTKVIDVTENVPPPKQGERPVIVKPSAEADKVLELNAGMVKRLGISIGDTVEFLDR